MKSDFDWITLGFIALALVLLACVVSTLVDIFFPLLRCV